ncbi:phage tail tape measure protein [Wenxinia marina]|uniref:Phage tail tape measure protein, lambda family n=1 Tax=Wenxinia marina DSM 24838 TaxID=1123501 RepID=A0A0D0PEW1_9RHOB|nr:phage tail tape measure protein [Wenxinia marina]KIQ69931.1 hypothetical protein Wenmar_01501 [Wenxinia marina DSM 24838]GGL62255.1 tail protein [Wenxinia marina]
MASPDFDDLDAEMGDLGQAMEAAGTMARAFTAELAEVRLAMGGAVRDLGQLERGFSRGLRRAIDAVVLDGASLGDALRGFGRSAVDTIYSNAMRPVTDHVGGILAGGLNSVVSGLMPFANGGAFTQGRVMPFARGGVLSGPTTFPMRGGTGLMGEAGPEAILPLARGADGRLGVRQQGGAAPVHVTVNVATPDVEGFRRSQGQIAAQVGRALSRGARNR